MTQLHESTHMAPAAERGHWTGWTIFAATMLLVLGIINLIEGFVALLQDQYFLVAKGDDLLVTDFTGWGVLMLIWGTLLIAGGLGLFGARGWARWFAVVVACLSIIIQIGFLAAYPVWSAVIIALDVLVILALTVHWDVVRRNI